MNSNKSERTTQVDRERVLERLKNSGGKRLTKASLVKTKSEEQALKELVRAGKVANLGSVNSSYYVLLRDQSVDSLCLSLAISAVKGLTEAGRLRLVTKSEIETKNKLPKQAREVLGKALKHLVDGRSLILLKAGKATTFYQWHRCATMSQLHLRRSRPHSIPLPRG